VSGPGAHQITLVQAYEGVNCCQQLLFVHGA
jgi:hypothetical protein